MKNDIILEKLINFIEQERGKYKFEINRNTLLQTDLEIYGLDAIDFISKFSIFFGVDTQSLNLNKYFKGDGIDFFSIFRINDKIKKEISVGNLEESIINKKLDDALIEK